MSQEEGTEAVAMLALRLQMDMLSLRVDAGEISLDYALQLLDFSAREVVRGSPHLESQITLIVSALKEKFAQAEYSKN
ncbi:MAG: hypothetical protein AAGH53_12595 [Pseudomonadota bacterium]